MATEIYVDGTNGDDTNGNGSESDPYATPQKALDSIPGEHPVDTRILLQPGVYDQNYRDAADPFFRERPAILYVAGKQALNRTTRGGNFNIKGDIVVEGLGPDPGACKIVANGGYVNGIYCTHTQLGLQNLEITASGTEADGIQNLLVANRAGAYVHAANVVLNGNNAARWGLTAEAGGQVEAVGLSVSNVEQYGINVIAGGWLQIGDLEAAPGFVVTDDSNGGNFGPSKAYPDILVDDMSFAGFYGPITLQGWIQISGASSLNLTHKWTEAPKVYLQCEARIESRGCNVTGTFSQLYDVVMKGGTYVREWSPSPIGDPEGEPPSGLQLSFGANEVVEG